MGENVDDVVYVDRAGRQHPAYRAGPPPQCCGGAGTDVIVKESTGRGYPDQLQLHLTDRQSVPWSAGGLAGVNRHVAAGPAAIDVASEFCGATVKLLAGLNSDVTMPRAVIPVADEA